MTYNNSDQRSQTRVAVKQKISAYLAEDGGLFGYLANFHDKGFMLISNCTVREDNVYRLRMEFSQPVCGRKQISVGAECLWVRSTSGDQVWAGFSIIDISEDDRHLLAELVAQLDGYGGSAANAG
jgi:hypothetical protein